MMVFLFPNFRNDAMAGEGMLVSLSVITYFWKGAWQAPVLMFLFGTVVLMTVLSMRATAEHQRILMELYGAQNPRAFVKDYAPLLKRRLAPANVRFTLHAYLSNGYAALGEFDKAMAILDSAPALRGRRKQAAVALLAGNRCNIELARGNLEAACKQWTLLKAALDSKGVMPKEYAALSGSLAFLLRQLKLLEGSVTQEDAEAFEKQLAGTKSPLQRTELSLLLGRTWLALKQTDKAKPPLSQAAAANRELWAARQADKLLTAC
ncbi:MAG: hypothetical protein EOM69_06180 [Clostridia bacterium]|nr:hypothetical protein [Clostridia bacterium]